MDRNIKLFLKVCLGTKNMLTNLLVFFKFSTPENVWVWDLCIKSLILEQNSPKVHANKKLTLALILVFFFFF